MNRPDYTPPGTTHKITIGEIFADFLNQLIEHLKTPPPVREPEPDISEERGDGFVKITVRLGHN